MIFLTVGTQLPFDRLTRALDAWCAATGRGGEVTAQLGETGPESYAPACFAGTARISPAAFEAAMRGADLVVSHAGMGSIIAALSHATPIVILPRRAHLGEQRNDHQLATARRFADRPGIHAAMEEGEIPALLDRLLGAGAGTTPEPPALAPYAGDDLIAALRGLIRGRPPDG